MKLLSSLWINALLFVIFCNGAKGEVNPYEELRALKSEFVAVKAFSILRLDMDLHEADSVLKNIEFIHKLAKEKDDKNLISVYYEMLGHYFSLRYDRVNSLATMNHEKAVQFAQDNSLDEQLFRQNFSFGNYYYTYFKYADAYRYFRQSLSLLEKLDENRIAHVWQYYLTLSRYFYDIKEYDMASQLLEKAVVYNNKLAPRELFDIINTLGLIALNRGKTDEALDYFKKVLEKSNAVLDSAWMGIAYGNMGNVYAQKHDINKALSYFELDYKYNSQASGDIISGLISLKKIAEIQFQQREFAKALVNIDIYLSKMEKKPIRYESLVEAYDLKARLLDTLSIEEGQLLTLKEATKYNRLLATLHSSSSIEMAKLEEEKSKYDQFYYESRQYKKLNLLLIVTLIGALSVLFVVTYNKTKGGSKREEVLVDGKEEEEYCPMVILSDKRFHVEDSHKPVQISLELRQLLGGNLMNNRNWEKFKLAYINSFPCFFSDMLQRYPELTDSDLRLLALINLNLSNKEVADKLSVSLDGVKKAKQRLKKKLSDHIVYN
ncbi:tetratricopeptide repeat protein [Sphingobacterium yanglingense]|uniref:Tetratricopeptide repeat protein n=1 Tax=Sphingobacterium yanglingense TaxID=1437280 RepID=A0A4R6WGG7_9SPHI|nr:tetratricopeptide repeat protein [Sphingobacterium yanglingense]TDQ76740.1 tetratricopeptide repeat protein [Sphingobacterium yanglingense]